MKKIPNVKRMECMACNLDCLTEEEIKIVEGGI